MKRFKIPPPDWVPLTEDLPPLDKGMKHTSVDVLLLTPDGRTVEGVTRDEDGLVECYEYRSHHYKHVEAVAWKSKEEKQ